jgi:dihydroorotate dehydrogenase (NAD+) catalytic subunit
LSLINTLTGMQINLAGRKPLLANKIGGLSGPAVKPVAIRMVYQIRQMTNLPIIGMGGVTTAEDVLEFLLAGASAVAVGTANFQHPFVCSEIIQNLPDVLSKYGFSSVEDAIGKGHEHADTNLSRA